MKKNIFNYSRNMLEDYFKEIGQKSYKATQVFEWLYQKNIYDFNLFSNIKQDN